ncbi:DUF6477 family protein [Rhodovulum euryhalinum]|uniref:Uncharacterized protein n=1 Tax=Rhodovulum euryhalinum TaxID=35805 RepID=A0A4R2KFA6_9RHOB|nr:DUF6477 family protein [Rhodovulum euryhalinum]TCO69046.1 hypothetical protein EV655_11943 [Rhodovulum euryhalinum]
MSYVPAPLAQLRRPRLMVQAARFGLADYRRERDLARLLPGARTTNTEAVVDRLIEAEARMDERRQGGDAGYSYARHIEILIALMAEARAFAATHPPLSIAA